MQINTIHELGGAGIIITIETSIASGLPGIMIVGFAGKSLDEAKERIRSSFKNSGDLLPKKKITINVSPSDIPKDGAHYDLAIALSILTQNKTIHPIDKDTIVLGELGLDGRIKPVRGIIGKIISSKKAGFKKFIIPSDNLSQASLINGILLLPANNLKDLVNTLSVENYGEKLIEHKADKILAEHTQVETDFSDVVGQAKAKRALEIAAAGGHNIILNGPPGVGKSMLAKSLPGIMSPPSENEILEITHIHSLTNSDISGLIRTRPFRSPHHSSSDISIIGGGQKPKPGEISLAHKGVLFLDELPEFKRSTIESLRQPLEDRVVSISRAKESISYPAEFILVATKNPCPCGFYGSSKECTCAPLELQKYTKKLSGPILDRIDIHVTVDNVEHKKLLSNKNGAESSYDIRNRVIKAQAKQKKRFSKGKLNSQMNNKEIKQLSSLTPEAKELLDNASTKLDISARVYMKLIKIARTIADLDGSVTIYKNHIAEAIQYRPIIQQ